MKQLDDVKAVIFDLDGTLVDSMWMWETIDIEFLGKYGYSCPPELQKTIEGMGFTETAVYFKERFSLPLSIEEIKQIWTDMCSPLPPWLPIWFPINVISEIAVPISLSLRLFANVLSGTVMMALVYGLLSKIAIIWPAALHVYFDLFSGAIQTYVFCMLTMTYIGQNYEQE